MVAAQSRNAKDAEILTLKRKTSDHIEELKKKENEMRVLKRNHHLSMPSEVSADVATVSSRSCNNRFAKQSRKSESWRQTKDDSLQN